MKQILNLTSIKNNKPDNFFICVGSPEDRCKGSIIKLDKNYKADKFILFRYSDSFNKKREENIDFIKNYTQDFNNYIELLIDEEKPIPVIQEIIEIFNVERRKNDNLRISLDFSTMIKWHFLILLKALTLNDLIKYVRFIYTEPEEYITELFQPLSFGIKNIFPIPTYYGNYDFSKETTLVIFLGYEGDRAISIFEKVDPSDCLLLIGKPAYHTEWEGRTEEMNRNLINLVGKEKIKYIDSRDPILISNQLENLLNNPTFSNSNKIIAPLGTKPQILGLFFYLHTNKYLNNVIYSSPLRHNHLFYSTGIGPTWEIQNIFNL